MPDASRRPLSQKLGYKPGAGARLVGLPPDLAEAFAFAREAEGAPATFLLGFARSAAEVAALAEAFAPAYPRGGALWLCYPKKTGAIPSDITRDRGWAPMTERGFLAVTQVAVDATWSALRFRRRDELAKITRRSA